MKAENETKQKPDDTRDQLDTWSLVHQSRPSVTFAALRLIEAAELRED